MSGALIESVQRLVLMEADLARILDTPDGSADSGQLLARLIANQQQIIETLVAAAEEIAQLQAAQLQTPQGSAVVEV